MKKGFKMPHAYVIIVIMLIIVSAMTYVIPAGTYDRVKNAAGITMVNPASFKFVASNPIPPWRIPEFILEGLMAQRAVIFPMIVLTGGLAILLATGAFHAFCYRMANISAGKEKMFIPVLLFVFSLIGITQAPYKFIGFAPLGVMLAATLGYDAIVGVAVVLLGIAIGFSCGIFGPTTAVAQQMAELPAYSGVSMRALAHLVLYAISAVYITRYAERAKADPTKSVLYGATGVMEFNVESVKIPFNKRHAAVLGIFVMCFAVMMYGCIKYSWGLPMCGVCFLWAGILGGLAYGFGPSRIAEEFVKGIKGAIDPAFLIGLAGGCAVMLSKARILDTVVMYSAQTLNYFPNLFKAPVLMLINTVINFFVPSATGQAAVVMPVMTPLADLSGLTRQTAVLAYKFGDGFSNYIYPHVSSLMGFIGAAGISYDKWMKFMGKLFAMWLFASLLIMMLAYVIQYQ